MIFDVPVGLAAKNNHNASIKGNFITQNVVSAHAHPSNLAAITWAIDVIKRKKGLHLAIVFFELLRAKEKVAVVVAQSPQTFKIGETIEFACVPLVAKELPCVFLKVPRPVERSTVHISR